MDAEAVGGGRTADGAGGAAGPGPDGAGAGSGHADPEHTGPSPDGSGAGSDHASPGPDGAGAGRDEVRPEQPPRAAQILHLTEQALWDEARAAGGYEMSTRGRTLGDVGFIHCSLRHQLPEVAALLYGAEPYRTDLVVLVIEVARLDVPVRYEPPVPGGEEFPHVYGPLPVAAVVDVEPWPIG